MNSNESNFNKIIELINSKVSLSELIGKDVDLQKRGNEFLGRCPFHNEKTPSFTVSDHKNFYHCFGCGAHGDAIKYLMDSKNLKFFDAVEILASEYNIKIPKDYDKINFDKENSKKQKIFEILKCAADYFHNFLKTNQKSQQAIEYIKKRKISDKSIDLFKIGFCDGSCTKHLLENGYKIEDIIEAGISTDNKESPKDKFINRIIFPIFDLNNKVIAFGGRLTIKSDKFPKYLNSQETIVFQKRNNLFNLNNAHLYSKEAPIIIVEGYMDAVSMVQYGFKQTVASLGTALTNEQIFKIWKYSKQPILCFDGDNSGIKASIRTALRIFPELIPGTTLFFSYLPDGLDPDEVLKKHGADSMNNYINNKLHISDVIWNNVLSNYNIDKTNNFLIPEDKVALKKEIFDIVKSIKNKEVSQAYNDLFSKKFYEFFKATKDKHIDRVDFNLKKFKSNVSIKNKHEISQKILLGILLKAPILLLEVDEFLLSTVFSDEKLSEIKDWLLNEYFLDSDFEEDSLKEKRELFIDVIGKNILKTHASFIFDKSTSNEEMLKRWKDIWFYSVEDNVIKEDISDISNQLKSEFSINNWKRLKSLSFDSKKNRVL